MSDLESTTLGKEDKPEDSISIGSAEALQNNVSDNKVWSKLDRHILPLIAMFYLLSFLVKFGIQSYTLARTDSVV